MVAPRKYPHELWERATRLALGPRLSEVKWQNSVRRERPLPRDSGCPDVAICPDCPGTRQHLSAVSDIMTLVSQTKTQEVISSWYRLRLTCSRHTCCTRAALGLQ